MSLQRLNFYCWLAYAVFEALKIVVNNYVPYHPLYGDLTVRGLISAFLTSLSCFCGFVMIGCGREIILRD